MLWNILSSSCRKWQRSSGSSLSMSWTWRELPTFILSSSLNLTSVSLLDGLLLLRWRLTRVGLLSSLSWPSRPPMPSDNCWWLSNTSELTSRDNVLFSTFRVELCWETTKKERWHNSALSNGETKIESFLTFSLEQSVIPHYPHDNTPPPHCLYLNEGNIFVTQIEGTCLEQRGVLSDQRRQCVSAARWVVLTGVISF